MKAQYSFKTKSSHHDRKLRNGISIYDFNNIPLVFKIKQI